MRIRGSVAVVTGASSGIGAAAVARLSAAGAVVVAHGRDERRLGDLAGRTGAVPVVGDLSDPAEVSRLAKVALAVEGRIDIVVNNAGVGWAGSFARMPVEDVDRLVAVNLAAPVGLTRAVLPAMLDAGGGCLMFVSSIAARTGVCGEAVYAATKAGLDTFAESLRWEVAGTGVRVGVVVPAVVATPFFDRRGRPYLRRRPRPLPPGRVADALVGAIVRDEPERYTPPWLRLPVLIRAAAPGLYRRLAARYGGAY